MRLYLVSVFACSVTLQPGSDRVGMDYAHMQSLQKALSEEDAVRQVVADARGRTPNWTDDWRLNVTVKEVDQVALRTALKELEQ